MQVEENLTGTFTVFTQFLLQMHNKELFNLEK